MTANTEALPRTRPVTREQKPEPVITLTPMQRKCLEMASKGFTSKQTGELLDKGASTVEWHLGNCRIALDASTTTEACCIAIRKGLIP